MANVTKNHTIFFPVKIATPIVYKSYLSSYKNLPKSLKQLRTFYDDTVQKLIGIIRRHWSSYKSHVICIFTIQKLVFAQINSYDDQGTRM